MSASDATDLVGNWLMDKADPAIEADRQVLAAWREIRKRLVNDPSVVVDCIQTQNTGRACAALDEPGWVRVGRYDRARRRALWLRVSDDAIELRSGREGDDSYARISKDAPHFEELRGLFQRANHSGGPSCFCGDSDCTGNTPEEWIPDDWADEEQPPRRCTACGHEDRP